MANHTNQHSFQCQSCPCCELSSLNLDFRNSGTRFRLFAQTPLLEGFEIPETVWLSKKPHEIGPGPADNRMYVVDAIDKQPYEYPNMPPFLGDVHSPAAAGDDGHFDHLEIGTHQFEAAHMYGTLRFVMDIWECYLGHEIEWSFADTYPYLEIVPWLDWNNAHCGYGFIEAGYRLDDDGRKFPLNMNFDVLAHEFGHAILYSKIGMPTANSASTSYFAYHEAASDMVAIISVLHFDSVVDRLLSDTRGNLYATNELNRVGEESQTRQIRMASNSKKMTDVPDPNTPRNQLSYKQIHDISLPMTGALFDLLLEIYQQGLVNHGLISPELDQLSRGPVESDPQLAELIQQQFDNAYSGQHDGFKKALIDSRDLLGQSLTSSWEMLSPDLSYFLTAKALLNTDILAQNGNIQQKAIEVLQWRDIVV